MKIILILALLVPGVAEAKPWYKDWTNYLRIGIAAGSSIYATREIHHCRQRNDLIHCPDGGYGAFKAREGIRFGASMGIAAVSVYGHGHWTHGWKNALVNDLPVGAITGYNIRVGYVNQSRPTFPKEDLSDIHIIK